MSNITIRNFGAIKEQSAPIEIKKVTFFIGNQGSGKSTVAKLIATFMWIEKALFKESYNPQWFEKNNTFRDLFLSYHRLENYLKENTYIQYTGSAFSITYTEGQLSFEKKEMVYALPQLMYVPSERNFISYMKSMRELKVASAALNDFLAAYTYAKEKVTEMSLPINESYLLYDKNRDTLYVKGKDYRVQLSEASSGFQSLVPLFLVSDYLVNSVKDKTEPMSIEERKQFEKQIKEIYANPHFTEEQRRSAANALSEKFNKTSFVNIVEEPEQNLFPTSQRDMLYSLLKINNEITANKLIITTHSPYLVNYVSVSVEAGKLKQGVIAEKGGQLSEIVPINADDLAIYQLKEEDGTIQLLDSYEGIPSDENMLNLQIDETNNLFADLLDLK
nr:AAA family ATPase [uncultured Capnocytophaga sp.]